MSIMSVFRLYVPILDQNVLNYRVRTAPIAAPYTEVVERAYTRYMAWLHPIELCMINKEA